VFKVRVKGEVDIFLPGGNGLCTVVWVAMICWCVFVILIYRLWWMRGNRLGVAISHSWHEKCVRTMVLQMFKPFFLHLRWIPNYDFGRLQPTRSIVCQMAW
jgi:heme/copper-type cytochrome/quinol oxidase subunit 2